MESIAYPAPRLDRLTRSPIFVVDAAAIHEIVGPGAAQCLQGILTNDVVAPGAGALIYAAGLSAKGMIVVDYWVLRGEDGFLLIADRSSQPISSAMFRRLLPPRLARVTDLSEAWRAVWLIGADWDDRVATILGAPPEPGRVATVSFEGAGLSIAAAPSSERTPFRYLVAGPSASIEAVAAALNAAGATAGSADDLRAMRVLAGFPTLHVEIDDKTLPQEVDYDELGAVSYSKGCYVGQETVARLHFRGKSNWLLRGVELSAGAEPPPDAVEHEGKPAVRLGTLLTDVDGTSIGLAKVRREIEPGTSLAVAGRSLRVTTLPFPRQHEGPGA